MTKEKMREELEGLGVIANEELSGKELTQLLKDTKAEAEEEAIEEEEKEAIEEEEKEAIEEIDADPIEEEEEEPVKDTKSLHAGKKVVSRDKQIINGVERTLVTVESGETILI